MRDLGASMMGEAWSLVVHEEEELWVGSRRGETLISGTRAMVLGAVAAEQDFALDSSW